MPRSARQEVCGLVVNDGVHVPREHRRLLRAILHDAGRRGLSAAAQVRGRDYEKFPEWLAGHLAYLAAVDPEEAERMLEGS